MTRSQVQKLISDHREDLHRMSVKSLALFGSVRRDEAGESSDVDLLVEFDRPIGYFHFFDVQEYLQKLLNVPKVDLVMRDAVIEELKKDILEEALDVF
jgi:predicted nucleotidyltransferase